MKFYGVAVAVGMVLLIIAVPQLAGATKTSPPMLLMAIVGGFGVLGGLFGLVLAAFFHLWHHKGDAQGE